jgi:hypothetical protein
MDWRLPHTALCLPLCILLAACDVVHEDPDDPVIARVYDHSLRLSETREYIIHAESAQDSLAQLRNYVEHWVRETLLLHEAEKYMPADIDIDELVEDYRSTLIVSNFEQNLVQVQLDTIITDEELQTYYERNKEQYQLERPIIRCHFLKVKKPVPERNQLRRWWDNENQHDFNRLVAYGNRYAEVFMLEDSTWYQVEEIENLMPPGTLSSQNMRRNRSLRFTDDQYEYYLRIHESVLSTEIAPLSYIREQATRYIMHKRKLELLERIKADLYRSELDNDQVQIHI